MLIYSLTLKGSIQELKGGAQHMQEAEEKEKYHYRIRKVRIKIERKIIFRGFQGLIAVTLKKKKYPAEKISGNKTSGRLQEKKRACA